MLILVIIYTSWYFPVSRYAYTIAIWTLHREAAQGVGDLFHFSEKNGRIIVGPSGFGTSTPFVVDDTSLARDQLQECDHETGARRKHDQSLGR